MPHSQFGLFEPFVCRQHVAQISYSLWPVRSERLFFERVGRIELFPGVRMVLEPMILGLKGGSLGCPTCVSVLALSMAFTKAECAHVE